jgi:hypothetical protein
VTLVMEATEDSSTNDVPWRSTAAGRKPTRAEWRLHAKTAMWSAVVVAKIRVQNVCGVNLVEDDQMVEAIAAQSSVQTLANGVGLRRSWWRDWKRSCISAVFRPRSARSTSRRRGNEIGAFRRKTAAFSAIADPRNCVIVSSRDAAALQHRGGRRGKGGPGQGHLPGRVHCGREGRRW